MGLNPHARWRQARDGSQPTNCRVMEDYTKQKGNQDKSKTISRVFGWPFSKNIGKMAKNFS
jgi:hypothetical protein